MWKDYKQDYKILLDILKAQFVIQLKSKENSIIHSMELTVQ